MIAVALVVLLLLAHAAPARADSCLEALRVDGYLLHGITTYRPLPAAAGEVGAVIPACVEDDDREVAARRLRGLPATVAVEYAGELYMAEGALPMVQGHPLRSYFRPRARRRRCRTEPQTLRGTAEETLHIGFALPDRRARPTWVFVDRRTRITNRPAHQPLVHGQRIAVAATRCRPGWFADRITFVGSTVRSERELPGPPWGWIAAAIAVVAVGARRLLRRG